MPKSFKNIFLISLVLFFCSTYVFAAEEITITTYYPSPYGSYKQLSVAESGALTAQDYGLWLTNTATSSTASINKYGMYVSSTGTWNGASANNYGLYIDTPTGGTNNYGLIVAGGNVGIGTTSPGVKLDITAADGATPIRFNYASVPTQYNLSLAQGVAASDVYWTFVHRNANVDYNAITIRGQGKVGIGLTAPLYALDVTGQIRMSGATGTKQVVADVAEVIPVADDVEEADVVCIDNSVKKYQFAKSKKPDSLLVAGVISSTKKDSKSIPALFIGDAEQKQKDNPGQKYRYLTIAGQIAVKVCLEGGTIKKGDLLTSSSVSGYAMKSQTKQLGTLIGKALEDFDGENGKKGTIIALLNLM